MLKVDSHCNQRADSENERRFDRFPVVIGRSASCDYVLDDVSKYISANHATIVRDEHGLAICDTSANGVFLNGSASPIGRGNRVALADGDRLSLGEYSISVSIGLEANESPAVESRIEAGTDPFDDLSSDRDLGWDVPAGEPAHSSLEDDDLWGDTDSTPAAPVVEPAISPTTSNWADWDAEVAKPSVVPPGPPAPASRVAEIRPRAPSVEDEFDWMHEHEAETVAASPVVEPPRRSPSRPGSSRKPVARSTPPASTKTAHALLLAAGVDAASIGRQDAATLERDLGILLGRSLDGIMSLLRSRGDIKRALHSEETRLERVGNNPLKFEAGAAGALRRLLDEDGRGTYLDAEHAIAEAVEELELHQLAILDAMKQAVKETFTDLAPENLEAALAPGKGLATSLIGSRDARLWQAYQENWASLRAKALGRFGERFGDAFDRALAKRSGEPRRQGGQ